MRICVLPGDPAASVFTHSLWEMHIRATPESPFNPRYFQTESGEWRFKDTSGNRRSWWNSCEICGWSFLTHDGYKKPHRFCSQQCKGENSRRVAQAKSHLKRRTNRAGYVQVGVAPDSPFACMADGGGYIREHRLVMAKQLGRPLAESELVHHIDGDRANNAVENLQLFTLAHPRGVRMCCRDCGSTDFEFAPLT